jgi:hypothetical protein
MEQYKTIKENEIIIHPFPQYVKVQDILTFESKISAEEKIRKLILSTPNDQELGKIIRELYGQN